MSKVNTTKRSMVIRQRKLRQRNIQNLKALYSTARSEKERKSLVERLKKFAPYLRPETFFAVSKP
ncbi:MAG: hypothetical protein AAB490_05245 [Patescibacteria group bacterium]